jgi:hypothetical protein
MNSDTTTLKEQLLAGKTVATHTSGVSMEPLLHEQKTHVMIQSICQPDGSRKSLNKGELPIYLRPDGKYVIHRLIKEDGEYYYTRGDNCLTWEKIPKEWVLGVVVEIYRKGKNIKVTDKRYRQYVRLWMWSYPIRSMYYRVRIFWHRIARRISRL